MNKLTIPLLFIVCSAQYSFGQSLKSSTDDFDGTTSVETKGLFLHSGLADGVRMKISKTDGMYTLKLECYTTGVFSHSEGDEMMLKLGNGEIITLQAYSEGVANYSGSNWYDTFLYEVNETDLRKIQKSGIEKYRVYSADRIFEHDVKKSANKKIGGIIKSII